MRAFSRTYFDNMKASAEHADKQRDLDLVKKAAHQDLIRKCKWSKGKKYRAVGGGGGGLDINVQCKQQASSECAFNKVNIETQIAPKIDWKTVLNPKLSLDDQVHELYTQIQGARRTYKPLVELDIKPRKRKLYDAEDDNDITQQTIKYWRLKQEYSQSLKQSAAYKHKQLMADAMQDMIARGKKLKKIIDGQTNTAYMFQLRHHDEAKPPSAKLVKASVRALLQDTSVPKVSVPFLMRMQVLVENGAERKTWNELVVETEEVYTAKQRKKQRPAFETPAGYPNPADFVVAGQREPQPSVAAAPHHHHQHQPSVPAPKRRTPGQIIRSIGRTIGFGN
jgi:hypothetical protein